jgi:CBS domain-containing protein
MEVRELMTRDVMTFTPESSLRDAAAVLVARGITGAPVCDVAGRVIGVLSESDIVAKEQGADTEGVSLFHLRRDRSGRTKQAARTVKEAMTSPPITVRPTTTVAAAAKTMMQHGVNRLPVVDGDRLAGIVTRADLVRAFTRPDDAIRDELFDMIQRQLWIPRHDVTIEVHEGDVSISGEVENRSVAELVSAFASRVPGVVDVHSTLVWRDDDLRRRLRLPALARRN